LNPDLLMQLLQTLDAVQYRNAELDRYYNATQDLAFLSPDAQQAIGSRFGRMASNLCRLAVTSLAERLRIIGFAGDPDMWGLWLANDLDEQSDLAHREALTLGTSYVTVWGDDNGNPLASVESSRQVAVLADPGTRQITSAVKRWRTQTTTESVLYLPDVVYRLRADSPGAQSTGFYVINELENPLGVVPVVQLRNTERVPVAMYGYPDRLMSEFAHSELWDLMPLVDGINKLLADLMVAAEYTAQPRRWATGIELVELPQLDDAGNPVLDANGDPVMEAVSPIPEGDRAMIAEKPEAKFGQLDGANLSGYQNAVAVLMQQIMAVSALPEHMVGITSSNPASADAIRSAEAGLTSRAEAKQKTFGKSWEQVGRLMVAIRHGVDPSDVPCQVQWCDPSTISSAQEADAVLKLVQAGVLSKTGALRKLGFTEDQINAELSAMAAEADANADPTMKNYFGKQFDAGDKQ
jgi:Phage portal protein, SPP1 Gp6-like